MRDSKATAAEPTELGSVRIRRTRVATNSESLAVRLRSVLAGAKVVFEPSLVDLIKDVACEVFVVDMKAPDIRLWPAPLLLDPDSQQKFWILLFRGVEDLEHLRQLPANCAIFQDNPEGLERLIEFLQKRADPGSQKRFTSADYLPSVRTFLVKMENGKAYLLQLDGLREADGSAATRCAMARTRHFFTVFQESGNRFEVPWDAVLYHREPSYEFYKGREPDGAGEDRAIRIGERVRAARLERGMSVSDVAERAGMKRPNLSRLEHGHHEPSLETIERIAQALGVTVAQLVVAKG